MIQLLFLVLFAEGIVAFLLMVKIGPLRDLVMLGLDQLKTGKGPATVKTIASTMSVIFASNVYSILKIQNKGLKIGTVTPMDQVLWRTHLLEASLMGYSLFLGLIIDRLHDYLQKLTRLRSKIGDSKHDVQKLEKDRLKFEEKEKKALEEMRLLQEEISNIIEDSNKLKLELEEKDKRVISAEAHVAALQKQSEDLLLEYDRLLEDNQNLQSQTLGYRS